jgi:hypothetical protein
MTKLKLLAAAGIAALSTLGSAQAFTLLNSTLDDPGAYNAGTVNGYSYYAGPIGFQTDTAGTFEVYCVDLTHYLQNGKTYHFGLLTTDGQGNALTELQSYEIGKIAAAGFANLGDQDFAAAAQLAIWAIEYGTTATGFKDAGIGADYATLFSEFAGGGADFAWAKVVIPDAPWPDGGEWGSSQQMVVGLSSAPEASTWAMGLMGFAFLGAVAGYKRRSSRYALEA